jgi:hypothetical protein
MTKQRVSIVTERVGQSDNWKSVDLSNFADARALVAELVSVEVVGDLAAGYKVETITQIEDLVNKTYVVCIKAWDGETPLARTLIGTVRV